MSFIFIRKYGWANPKPNVTGEADLKLDDLQHLSENVETTFSWNKSEGNTKTQRSNRFAVVAIFFTIFHPQVVHVVS